MTCAKCNTDNIFDATFCATCGASLAPAPQFCSQCATPATPNAVFCTKCGQSFRTANDPRLRPAMVRYVPGAMVVACPRCGSPFTSHVTAVTLILCIVLFPIGMLALLMPRENRCVNPRCYYRW